MATAAQVLFCVVFYGGFIALVIEYIVKSLRDRGRPNPIGDLEE